MMKLTAQDLAERCVIEEVIPEPAGGAQADYAVCMGARGDDAILCGGPSSVTQTIQMDGKAVFRFAVDALPKTIQQILTQSACTLDEIDWVVCHQANERIIDR